MSRLLLILIFLLSLKVDAQNQKSAAAGKTATSEARHAVKIDLSKKLELGDETEKRSIVVFPNPLVDKSKVSYNLKHNVDNFFTVYSLLGTKVFEKKLITKKGEFYLEVSDFSPGVYYYALKSKGEVVETKKMVVK